MSATRSGDRYFPELADCGQFQKNGNEMVKARLVDAHGLVCGDIRVFRVVVGGEPRPMRKGICLDATNLPQLRALVEAMIQKSEELKQAGGGAAADTNQPEPEARTDAVDEEGDQENPPRP